VSWSAVVAALDRGDAFRSRVSVYLHPLAGRPIAWHVVRALCEAAPPPDRVRVLHLAEIPMALPSTLAVQLEAEPVQPGSEAVALRAALTTPGVKVLADGAAPLLAPSTIARLLRAGEVAPAALMSSDGFALALVGEGPALASAEDPRRPVAPLRVAPTTDVELIRVHDRHSLSEAAVAIRDQIVRLHEANGVSFLLPATTWVDADVRIGPDSVIYPGAVLEGQTEIGPECVIGPYSRLVDATIGRGVELKGWNYVTRTAIRNHAVLEPHVRRGFD
jgi:bifunctional N-acetylglucosamine-1-phosphate-uridyltransferase/glucosamine-1-phosphate-acetyltransferase GlmU-like protein